MPLAERCDDDSPSASPASQFRSIQQEHQALQVKSEFRILDFLIEGDLSRVYLISQRLMIGSNFPDMQMQHALHLQQRQQQQQQQISPRLTPTPPTSSSPVPSEYCAASSSHYPGVSNESGTLAQHLQQLQLQQQQQQPLLQHFSPPSPLHGSSGPATGTNSAGNAIMQTTSRPAMGSIVQGTPIVPHPPLIPTATSRGYFALESSSNAAAVGLQRAQGGSIMQGTPYNVLPVIPNTLTDAYVNPSSSSFVPVASFGGGGSIMQGTPVNKVGVMEFEDMEATEDTGTSGSGCDDNGLEPAAEEALDLSVNKPLNTRTGENQWAPRQIDSHLSCLAEQQPIVPTPPHPQISVTDEEGGEVTDMDAWSVHRNVGGGDGSRRRSGMTASSRGSTTEDDLSSDTVGPELHKSSSGSIEVQLSSDCSQLTVAEIFALIKQSIHNKASGLVSCQMEDAAALLLERPGEDIHIAVEVSPPTGPEGLKGLKIRRISGDFLRYDRICNELIACISM